MADIPKNNLVGKAIFTAVVVVTWYLGPDHWAEPNYAYWVAAILGVVWFDWMLIGGWKRLIGLLRDRDVR